MVVLVLAGVGYRLLAPQADLSEMCIRDSPCTGKAVAGAMRRHGVLACPLSAYFHTGRCSEAGPALVLGFGGLAQQDIRPAAQAMARAAEEACAQHG